MDDLIQRLRDAEWDRDRWKAKAEELAVLEPRLLSFDGAEVRIAVAKHVSSLIADSMLTILDSVDAPNYVEMTFNRVEGDAVQEYRATFHRPGCKTPHQVKDEALAALSAAEARVKELEGALRRTADGVVVLPGMKLYPLYPVDLGLPPEEAADFDDHAVIVLAAKDNETGDFVVEGDELDIGKCYSTPAAAAAARAEKEGERQ